MENKIISRSKRVQGIAKAQMQGVAKEGLELIAKARAKGLKDGTWPDHSKKEIPEWERLEDLDFIESRLRMIDGRQASNVKLNDTDLRVLAKAKELGLI